MIGRLSSAQRRNASLFINVKRSKYLSYLCPDGSRKDVRVDLTLSGSPKDKEMHWTAGMFINDEYVPDFLTGSSDGDFRSQVRMTLGLMRDSILDELRIGFDTDVESFLKELSE